ncbi:MAG: hypothetical protein IJQ12_05415 [Lachnospiraceae bacterium]|nr:hypothetical protein [Lachnospiraceae bacterium]
MKRHPHLITLGLLISSLGLTAAGAYGRTRAYARYPEYTYTSAPLLTLPLQGIRDGVSFWDPAPEITVVETEPVTEPEAPQDEISEEVPADSSEALPEELPEDVPEEVPDEISEEVTETSPVDETPDIPRDEPAPLAGAPHAAEDTYYADALFIGDSRTVGLSQYCPALDAQASFYCQVSLTVFGALTAPCATTAEGVVTIERALETEHFGKVYLMIGINEIGYDKDGFIEAYAQLIAKIRALQPEAVIYIQSIMHVSSQKEIEQPVFNNAAVNERNEALRLLANDTDIFYIDLNYKTDDANGALDASLTFDGVHLTAGAYDLWYQAIKEQTR